MRCSRIQLFFSLLVLLFTTSASAQRLEIPRRHEKPPGPPLSAEEAVQKMVVPEGFSVEIVAQEPDVVNPVGMAIDEQGRFWITESFEYPRREPGPGKDRIKVLEDTDGDGTVDKVTIFAEGLNIPSGVAVGHGGVWVANAPDLLFMQDTDGDLKADKIEKVVTGFGRTDTHELPNSLTWGPDGWLYGLNGVFNYCDVKYTAENPNYDPQHPGWKFTCAMFRIHPRTREFQIFAEGTSNPWGIAFNGEGEAFISACVIDHLWHITESAYYIRQGGPYPPHTWPMRSIVDHKHQKAAYCGIHWFDSDAYPEEYRNVLYMGNIHGGCINADIVEHSGATYQGKPHPGFPAPDGAFQHDTVRKIGEGQDAKLADFLTANDAWFMPVVQKTGPDGCLYILDWYDRYHCYQDANADPEGIERSKGRLYRVVYKGHEHRKAEDIGQQSNAELLQRLDGANDYIRTTARRLLQERLTNDSPVAEQLRATAANINKPTPSRLQALWTLAGSRASLSDDLLQALITDADPQVAAWGVRIVRNLESDLPGTGELTLNDWLNPDGKDPYQLHRFAHLDQRVLLQLPPLIANYEESPSLTVPPKFRKAVELVAVQTSSAGDPLVTHVVWQNLLRVLQGEHGKQDFLTAMSVLEQAGQLTKETFLIDVPWLDRAVRVLMAEGTLTGPSAAMLIRLAQLDDQETARRVINAVYQGIQDYQATETFRQQLSQELRPTIRKALLDDSRDPLRENYLFLGSLIGMEEAVTAMRQAFDASSNDQFRLRALKTLIAIRDPEVASLVEAGLLAESSSTQFRAGLIDLLGVVNDPRIGEILLRAYPQLAAELHPRIIELLTQRDIWALQLLQQIETKQLSKDQLNLNQLRRISATSNQDLQQLVTTIYGQIRTDQRSDRQHVINFHRDFLNGTPGDPHKGIAVFKKVCAQCHKIYGEGAEVGPDITRNGRSNWNQLLQNVFDPSAVIGPGYQARQLATEDGRVLTGLPVEESDERVVLKIQGGKLETIRRSQIEAYKVSELSMMPEDLEKQLKPQELADLFAFLALDRPPTDPQAKILSGAPQQKVRD